MDDGGDIVTGDLGQDRGLWTLGVTLGLVIWDRTGDSVSDFMTSDVGQDRGLWTLGVTLGLVTWDRTGDCGQCE